MKTTAVFGRRLFFAAMLALTLGGVITLNRVVTGRWSLWPLVEALLSHNLYTLLGFFSFDLGVALVLWALAGRLWLMNRSLAVQLAVEEIKRMELDTAWGFERSGMSEWSSI